MFLNVEVDADEDAGRQKPHPLLLGVELAPCPGKQHFLQNAKRPRPRTWWFHVLGRQSLEIISDVDEDAFTRSLFSDVSTHVYLFIQPLLDTFWEGKEGTKNATLPGPGESHARSQPRREGPFPQTVAVRARGRGAPWSESELRNHREGGQEGSL